MESMQLKSVEHYKVSKKAHEEDHKKTNMTNQSRQVMGLVEKGWFEEKKTEELITAAHNIGIYWI